MGCIQATCNSEDCAWNSDVSAVVFTLCDFAGKVRPCCKGATIEIIRILVDRSCHSGARRLAPNIAMFQYARSSWVLATASTSTHDLLVGMDMASAIFPFCGYVRAESWMRDLWRSVLAIIGTLPGIARRRGDVACLAWYPHGDFLGKSHISCTSARMPVVFSMPACS